MEDINNFSVHYVTCVVGYPEHLQNSDIFIESRETVLLRPSVIKM